MPRTALGQWSTYRPSTLLLHRFLTRTHLHRLWFSDELGSRAGRLSSSSAHTTDRQNIKSLTHTSIPSQSRVYPEQDVEGEVESNPSVGGQERPQVSENHVGEPKNLRDWVTTVFSSDQPSGVVKAAVEQRMGLVRHIRDRESLSRSAVNWILSGEHQLALNLLQAAHMARYPLNQKQNVYETVALQLAGEKEWDAVVSVVDEGLGATGKTTARLLNWKARALAEARDFQNLDLVLENFASHGIKPQRRTYEIILSGYLRNHDLARAKTIMTSMEEAGFLLDASAFSRILPAYRGFGPDQFVQDKARENILQGSGEMTRRIFNGLLRLHMDKRDLDSVFRLLDTFGSKRVILTQPSDFAEQKQDDPIYGPLVDTATYTMLIDALLKHQHFQSLNSIIDRARNNGGLDQGFAAALIRMYYTLGLESLALRVLQAAFLPTTFNSQALKGLGYRANAQSIPDFGSFVGDLIPEPFNSVLQGAVQSHGISAVRNVLVLMRDAGIAPDEQTLEIFLSYLHRQGVLLSEDLGPILHAMMSQGLQPSLKHLNSVLRSIVRSHKRHGHQGGWNALASEVAQKLQSPISDMSGPKRGPADSTPAPLTDPDLSIIRREPPELCEQLEPLLNALLQRGVRADRATFALRLRYDAYTLHPSEVIASAERTLKEMRDRGLHPTAYHYSALLEAYCIAGEVSTATAKLQELLMRDVLPHRDTYTILFTVIISAHARAGRPEKALEAFRTLLTAGIAPDLAAVDAVVGAFYAVRAYGLARRVLLDLWSLAASTPGSSEDPTRPSMPPMSKLQNLSLSKLISLLRKSRRSGVVNAKALRRSHSDRKGKRRHLHGRARAIIDEILVAWKTHQHRHKVAAGPDTVGSPSRLGRSSGSEMVGLTTSQVSPHKLERAVTKKAPANSYKTQI